MRTAFPLRIPLAQHVITGLFHFWMVFIFDEMEPNGIFLLPFTCPPANSTEDLTSTIKATSLSFFSGQL